MAPDSTTPIWPPEYQEPEGTFRRLLRRMREEPLIPLGMILTVAAFSGAARAIKQRDHAKANIMFRRRIYAQGFTLLAIVAGSFYLQGDREKRREVERLEKEREQGEKRERWLKELEVRELEDREAKERIKTLNERRRKRQEELDRKAAEVESQVGDGSDGKR